MPRTQCSYCGLPFNVRRIEPGRADYCCSGCALASRLPLAGGGGQFPVTLALVVALGAGLALFNQVLFWVIALALAREHRVAEALLCARISVGLGIAILVGMVAALWGAGCRRWQDGLMTAATLGVLAVTFGLSRSAGDVVLANTVMALWLARGWGRREFARKRPLTI